VKSAPRFSPAWIDNQQYFNVIINFFLSYWFYQFLCSKVAQKSKYNILNTDLKTLAHLCSTSKRIRYLCNAVSSFSEVYYNTFYNTSAGLDSEKNRSELTIKLLG